MGKYSLLSYDPKKILDGVVALQIQDTSTGDTYSADKLIGDGTYGRVYKLSTTDNKKQLAAKIEKDENIPSRDYLLSDYLKLIKKGYPPNCGLLKSKLISTSHPIYIMDLFTIDVFDLIEKLRSSAPLQSSNLINLVDHEVVEIFYNQIIAQIDCLLEHDLYYTDLKLENVLVKLDGGLKFVLADTGALITGRRDNIVTSYANPYSDNANTNEDDVLFRFGLLMLLFRSACSSKIDTFYACGDDDYNTRNCSFQYKKLPMSDVENVISNHVYRLFGDSELYSAILEYMMPPEKKQKRTRNKKSMSTVKSLFSMGSFFLAILKHAASGNYFDNHFKEKPPEFKEELKELYIDKRPTFKFNLESVVAILKHVN